MNELTTIFDNRDWVNDLTKEMDKYLIGKWPESFCTYIYDPDRETDKYFGIRFPGATRGHIEVDENMIIKNIELYNGTCFDIHILYHKEVLDILSNYIGMKLVIVPKNSDIIECQVPNGTKIVQKETGEIYTIKNAIKTDNQWKIGVYLYQFNTPQRPNFGLYRKEFDILN